MPLTSFQAQSLKIIGIKTAPFSEIEGNLKNSHIILLLFSPDFIASEACKREVKSALKLKEKGAVFIPIILRDCAWKDVRGIGNIQALPADGLAITRWGDKDSAVKQHWVKICTNILQI
jgi:hypothetical protein